jgi:hypothetical protein
MKDPMAAPLAEPITPPRPTNPLARLGGWLDQQLQRQRPEGADPWGWRCFQLGVFLLPASAFLGAVLLFVSLVQGSRRRAPWWSDGCNRWLLAIAGLMLVGCLGAYSGWLAWVGLGNWLPFLGLLGLPGVCGHPQARRRTGLWFLAGTVPVIVTGLGQLYLGWAGPWQVLGGLIPWWITKGGNPPGRLSGLFDYANITGSWLALVWPFSLAALLQRSLPWQRRALALALAASLVASLDPTDSRNAWGALVLALPIVVGPASWLWLLPLLLLDDRSRGPGQPADGASRAPTLGPGAGARSDLGAPERSPLRRPQAPGDHPPGPVGRGRGPDRRAPLAGLGAAAFSLIYPLRTGHRHGHTHNLPIDLAISFGLPVAAMVIGFVAWLLLRSVRLGMLQAAVFERAWWAAALVLVALHATDMPLYDSRINIAGWILLAGLRWVGQGAGPRPAASIRDAADSVAA